MTPPQIIRGSAPLILALVGVATGFFYYAAGRALAETVHFDLGAAAAGLMLGGLFPMMFYGVAMALPLTDTRRPVWWASVFVMVVTVIAVIFGRAGVLSFYGMGFIGILASGLAHWVSRRAMRFSCGVLASALLVGALVAEAHLLLDDARFAGEVAHLQPDRPYSRARVWPAVNCALIYTPGRGIHATD